MAIRENVSGLIILTPGTGSTVLRCKLSKIEPCVLFPLVLTYTSGFFFWVDDAPQGPTVSGNTYTGARAGSEHIEATRPTDKRKAIQRLVESSGELSSRSIADAVGCCSHMVDAVRNELGIIPPATRKGKDGKHYPAKMKREPRGGKDK